PSNCRVRRRKKPPLRLLWRWQRDRLRPMSSGEDFLKPRAGRNWQPGFANTMEQPALGRPRRIARSGPIAANAPGHFPHLDFERQVNP
ncbi:MAG TPA: hypothetical protein VGS13_11375, partial [Stellaceae bacterium]|nr:hypothetical protein [Stellaceae bacterium]